MSDEAKEMFEWLIKQVTVMRRLGVTKWGGIELGPEPARTDEKAPPTAAQLEAYEAAMVQYRKELEDYERALDFAATEGTPEMPVMPEAP